MASTTDSAFWPRVKQYRDLGLDPLKWIAGCSVEVDAADVLYPAAAMAREPLAALAATLQLGEGPDVFEARETMAHAARAVVRPGKAPAEPRVPTRANPHRAALMMRVSPRNAATPEAFARALEESFALLPSRTAAPPRTSLDAPLTVGQLHAVSATDAATEFACFEFYGTGQGEAVGNAAASCESLQIADATLDPLADEHVATVVAAALAGCCAVGAVAKVELYPAFDAPGGKARDTIAASYAAEARKHGLTLRERPPIGVGKLFYGATVIAQTDREAPNRHHYVKRGMQILLTRPLGDLAPLAVYLAALSDPDYEKRAAAAGYDLETLAAARKVSMDSLTTPALAAARAIHDFSPPFHQPPELREHIAATADLGPNGLIGLSALARRFDVQLDVEEIPLANAGLSRFATGAHLMDNATASAPGAIAVVAYPTVLDPVERALAEGGGRPYRIGSVVGRGTAAVRVPAESALCIASKRLLSTLTVRAHA